MKKNLSTTRNYNKTISISKSIFFYSTVLFSLGLLGGCSNDTTTDETKDQTQQESPQNYRFYEDDNVVVYSAFYNSEVNRYVPLPEDQDRSLNIIELNEPSEIGDRVLSMRYEHNLHRYKDIYLEFSLHPDEFNTTSTTIQAVFDNPSTFLASVDRDGDAVSAYLNGYEFYNKIVEKDENNRFKDHVLEYYMETFCSDIENRYVYTPNLEDNYVMNENECVASLPPFLVGSSIRSQEEHEIFLGDTPIYYRWMLLDDHFNTFEYGNIHRTMLPRPLIFANLGDSFGSGEGAGAVVQSQSMSILGNDVNMSVINNRALFSDGSYIGYGWIPDASYNGTICHRAKASAQERFMRDEIRSLYPHHAYDYINVACSGATLTNISENAQSSKLRQTQIGLVEQWMYDNGYEKLDYLLLSAGGNDVKFADMIVAYLGPKIIGTGTRISLFPGEFNSNGPYSSDFTFKNLKLEKEIGKTLGEYFDILRDHYTNTATAINNQLSPNNVVVLEYPNILDGCSGGYHESRLITSMYDGNAIVESIADFVYDMHLILDVSQTESRDISDNVAGLATSGVGLNAVIKSLVNTFDAANSAIRWTYADNIARSHHNGICENRTNDSYDSVNYRRFNILYDAYRLGGNGADSHWYENAFHPNVYGHNDIYLPNIRAAILNRDKTGLKDDYLRQTYQNEHQGALADLVVDTRSHVINPTNYDFHAGHILNIETFISNSGGMDAANVYLNYKLVDQANGYIELHVHQDIGTVTIDDHQYSGAVSRYEHYYPLFSTQRDQLNFSKLAYGRFKSGITATPEDKVLAWYIPQEFKLSISVETRDQESSKINNNFVESESFAVAPASDIVSEEMISEVFTALNNTCSTQFSLQNPISETSLVVDSSQRAVVDLQINLNIVRHYSDEMSCVRGFFHLSNNESLASMVDEDDEILSIDTDRLTDTILDFRKIDFVPRVDSRSCILIDRGSSGGAVEQCIAEGATLDLTLLNLPEDGRVLDALVYDSSDVLKQHAKPITVQTLHRNAGIVSISAVSASLVNPNLPTQPIGEGINVGLVTPIVIQPTLLNNNYTMVTLDPVRLGLVQLQGSLDLIVPNETPTEVLQNGSLVFEIGTIDAAQAYRFKVGTERGGLDLKDVDIILGDSHTIRVDGIPQDGTKVYVSVSTQRSDGIWYDEHYVYGTSSN